MAQETESVGLDAKLYKQMAPIPDGTYISLTDEEFDKDTQETIISNGY